MQNSRGGEGGQERRREEMKRGEKERRGGEEKDDCNFQQAAVCMTVRVVQNSDLWNS